MVRRPAVVLGTLWVAGAVVATTVGLVAVRQVGNEVGGQVATPLSGAAVRNALTSVPPTPDAEEAEPSSSPDEVGGVRTVSTPGGVLGARCHDRRPTLLYATPADGYRTDRRSATELRFVGSRREVVVRLACAGEQLEASTTVERLGGATQAPPVPTATPSPYPGGDTGSPESPEPADGSSSPEPEGLG